MCVCVTFMCSCRRPAVHDAHIIYIYYILCWRVEEIFTGVPTYKVMQFIGLNLDIYNTGTQRLP